MEIDSNVGAELNSDVGLNSEVELNSDVGLDSDVEVNSGVEATNKKGILAVTFILRCALGCPQLGWISLTT